MSVLTEKKDRTGPYQKIIEAIAFCINEGMDEKEIYEDLRNAGLIGADATLPELIFFMAKKRVLIREKVHALFSAKMLIGTSLVHNVLFENMKSGEPRDQIAGANAFIKLISTTDSREAVKVLGKDIQNANPSILAAEKKRT